MSLDVSAKYVSNIMITCINKGDKTMNLDREDFIRDMEDYRRELESDEDALRDQDGPIWETDWAALNAAEAER
jgi:hypothetical protein